MDSHQCMYQSGCIAYGVFITENGYKRNQRGVRFFGSISIIKITDYGIQFRSGSDHAELLHVKHLCQGS